jgi:heme exporter protein B
MRFVGSTLSIVKKDILLEFRAKEALSIMVFLSLLLIVVFNLAVDIDNDNVSSLAPGILWVVFAFSGVLGMGKTSLSEREDGAYLNVFFSTVSMEVFYIAKVISNLIFLLFMELFTIVSFVVLFNYDALIKGLPDLALPLLLGSIGFSAVGTLFSFLSTGSRFGEIILPFLFLPVVVPVLIAGVSATELILNNSTGGSPLKWLKMLAVFDLLYISVSLMLFKHIVEE